MIIIYNKKIDNIYYFFSLVGCRSGGNLDWLFQLDFMFCMR